LYLCSGTHLARPRDRALLQLRLDM